MSNIKKIMDRIRRVPPDVRFDEVRCVLEAKGYVMSRPGGGSSHCIFRKHGCNAITIPCHTPIKKAYVRIVKDILEEDNGKDC